MTLVSGHTAAPHTHTASWTPMRLSCSALIWPMRKPCGRPQARKGPTTSSSETVVVSTLWARPPTCLGISPGSQAAETQTWHSRQRLQIHILEILVVEIPTFLEILEILAGATSLQRLRVQAAGRI